MSFALIDDPDPRDGGCTYHERHRQCPKTFLEEPFDSQLPLAIVRFRTCPGQSGQDDIVAAAVLGVLLASGHGNILISFAPERSTFSKWFNVPSIIWADHTLHEENLSFFSEHKNATTSRRERIDTTKCYGAFNYAYRSSSCVSSAKAALPLPGAVLELPPGAPEPSGNLKDVPKDLDCCTFWKNICNQHEANNEKDKIIPERTSHIAGYHRLKLNDAHTSLPPRSDPS
jgi:hypothetical protein